MNNQFLTAEELEELTGVARAADQKRVLDKNRIYYIERSDGKPKVCWYHVHHPMINSSNDDADINWDAA